MSNQFQNGLFGCFGDFKLCIITFVAPCYTIGKNAEHFGEDCMLHGLLAAIGLPFGPILRWRLRQQKDLEGTMMMDALLYTFCGCCALVQDAREMGWSLPKSIDKIDKKEGEEMTRE